jgi:predicted ATPase
LYDALSRMGFYNLNPDEIRDLQAPDMGEVLRRDGGNIASVLAAMNKGEAQRRIQEFLAEVVPGITKVARKSVGKKETLEFQQRAGQGDATWHFPAENMSDGTLRALGVLTALFQENAEGGRIPLVGIEEPEVAVHPGAAGILRDALRVASASSQVLVTSHSPDLLDDKAISPEAILGVANENGNTKIGGITETDRSAIRDQLFSAGELLKQGQLEPDIEHIAAIPQTQLDLFGRLEQ